jgi:hypothetical protein
MPCRTASVVATLEADFLNGDAGLLKPLAESRQGLVRRVASALLGLEALSDGKTAKIDPNRVHGGESAGLAIMRDKSPFDFHAGELQSWCDRAEARASNERKHTPQPMTPLEEDYWFKSSDE